jgi:flagellin
MFVFKVRKMTLSVTPPTSQLRSNTSALSASFKKLSSGKLINDVADDPAGSALAASLNADIKISKQGQRNGAIANSVLAVADSTYGQLNNISGRLAELATQAGSSILNPSQRQALDFEFQQLREESQRIISTTEFNGVNTLSSTSISVQIGNNSEESSQLLTPASTATSDTDTLSGYTLTSASASQSALAAVKSYSNSISQNRGALGATTSRLATATANLATSEIAQASAQAQIEDLDLAQATAQKTALQIGQQASVSLSAQSSKLNGQTALALIS